MQAVAEPSLRVSDDVAAAVVDDDRELLRRYVRDGSQPAFARLVERHVAMVYAAARRQLGVGDAAAQADVEDVVQAVFILLARKAASIGPAVSLPGWLYNAARMTAANARRATARRRHYEHQAGEAMRREHPHGGRGDQVSSLAWSDVEETLDAALGRLRPRDREALVLRFLSSRSLREVGDAVGISEDAARVRVNRALGRLRQLMGVTASVSALTMALDAGAAAAATAVPAHLAPTVAASALAPAAGSSAAALAAATAAAAATPVTAKLVVAAVAAMLLIGVPAAVVTLSGQSGQPAPRDNLAGGSIGPQALATTTQPAAANIPANGPRGVTLRLLRAAATADRATMRAAMHIENDSEARAADAAIELLVAEARLETTASTRFPDGSAATRLNKKLAQITAATEALNGDRATLTLPGSPPLHAFVRDRGQWKLIPSVALLERDALERLDARIEETNATRAAMDATAAEIDAGQFRTRAEADDALVRRLAHIHPTTGPAAKRAAAAAAAAAAERAERAAANPARPPGR